ncbi:MAG: CDP-alcohol phosphatidyltransferase family protein [Myxococcales bacterium]|nr:CDP-alcohol phosphatidyltransferase family protein [Myxococcota bacterium]MDW8284007.1 CDP-alcohol phosphatidyltransferase family protein [Myxococcales bacterium]
MVRGKPLVTANQVTSIRLALLPFGCWLLYQGTLGQWVALFFMTLVGCTDFVDGWLARRYGPTVLGGLMDPIADKLFIVVVFLPYIDLGWLPPWLVALLFLREFLVTGLRSAYERRGLKLQSTLLAQIKTWVQMGGAGVLFLLNAAPRRTLMGLLVAGVMGPFVMIAVRYLLRRYFWWKSLVFSAWFLGVLLAYLFWGPAVASTLLMLSMLAVTWISAWSYLAQTSQLLTGRSVGNQPTVAPLDRSDLVRILGAIAVPVAIVVAQAQRSLPSAALIIALAAEMAVGGLDNLLSHHGAQASALAWGMRAGTVALLSLLAALTSSAKAPLSAAGPLLALAAASVSLVGSAIEFFRGRHHYLDARLKAERLQVTRSHPPSTSGGRGSAL